MYKKLCVALCLPGSWARWSTILLTLNKVRSTMPLSETRQRVQGAFQRLVDSFRTLPAAARALADQLASVQSTIRQALQGRPDIVMAGLSRTAEMLERLRSLVAAVPVVGTRFATFIQEVIQIVMTAKRAVQSLLARIPSARCSAAAGRRSAGRECRATGAQQQQTQQGAAATAGLAAARDALRAVLSAFASSRQAAQARLAALRGPLPGLAQALTQALQLTSAAAASSAEQRCRARKGSPRSTRPRCLR